MTRLIALALVLASPKAWAETKVTAFVGVAVVPGDRERVVANQTVIVRDGRIAAIGPAGKVQAPPEAARIDGKGKFLMAGIAEMHGHLPDAGLPPEIAQQWLQLFVANGVTTVRGMQGAPNQFALRDAIARGELLGPQLFLYSPPLLGENTPTPEAAIERVREYKKAGYDGLKIHEGLSLPTYEAIARTAKELKMPFGGHVPNEVGLLRALAAGQRSIEHLDGYVEALAPDVAPITKGNALRPTIELLDRVDEKRIPALVSATRKAGAMVVPTMMVWRTLFGDASTESLRQLPELKYVSPGNVEGWVQERTKGAQKALPAEQQGKLMAVRNRVLAALAKAGGGVMLGADAPQMFSVPGFSLRNETRAMVDAGMTPWQVLQAATAAPARYLGRQNDFGTVQVGKRADVILVDGNPLEDVANIFRSSGVMLNGRWLARSELDGMLARIARDLYFPPDAEVKDLPVAASVAAALAGEYAFATANAGTATVYTDKGALLVRSSRGLRHRLRSQGDGTYLIPEAKLKVTFELHDGRASALVFSQHGARMKAARLPGNPPRDARSP